MITLEQRIARLEKRLLNEAMDPKLKEARATWRDVRTLDKEATKKCKALSDALRKAADNLDKRMNSYDGSDEGWDIHGYDKNNLSDFMNKLNSVVTAKTTDVIDCIASAQEKYNALELFMKTNSIDDDQLD